MEKPIQGLVNDIHSSYGNIVPIDPFAIAEKECIHIVEICKPEGFQGRIEYLRDVNRFVIYYPTNPQEFSNPAIRFSLAHELGHYFIDEHRTLLTKGVSHNSKKAFIHSNPLEIEADEFAGRLLIPDNLILPLINKKGFLTLKQIKEIACQCDTSITATVIRYIKIASKPLAILTSEKGWKKIYWPSPEAESLGFGGLGKDYIPPNSITSRVAKSLRDDDGASDTKIWFSQRRAYAELWEEACTLGKTGITLTLFTFTIKNENNDEWDGF